MSYSYRIHFIVHHTVGESAHVRIMSLTAPVEYQSDLDTLCEWASREFKGQSAQIESIIPMAGRVRPDGCIQVLEVQPASVID